MTEKGKRTYVFSLDKVFELYDWRVFDRSHYLDLLQDTCFLHND